MATTRYASVGKYGMPVFSGGSTRDPQTLVPEGFSLDKAYQDQESAGYIRSQTTSGAGRDGLKITKGRVPYYEKVDRPTAQAAEAAPEPTPEPPVRDEETVQKEIAELNAGRDRYDNTRLDRPENNQPRFGFSDDPYRDAIGHGDDLNTHYQNKFIPSLRAEAEQTSREVGFSGRQALNDFIGKVPQLGDPKSLFAYYSDKLNQSA